MTNEILNTCYILTQTTQDTVRIIANYSHIIPIILSLILGTFIFIKTKFDLFSKLFLAFIIMFSIWLLGDLITWTSNNYYLIYTTWSFLDYVEILFYVLGFYFATVFIKKSDITFFNKIILFLITLPAFFLTITEQSVTGFNHSVCEALNNDFLGQYKLIIEALILIVILIYILIPFFKKLPWNKKKNSLIVLGSMFIFLSAFGITEYLASITGYYEMNLYSLFLLPLFIIAIIYSVFELDIFNVKTLGSHYLVIGFMIIMGGQLFFIENTANRLLTISALVLAGGLGFILFRNLKKESDQRTYIEKLSIELQNSNSELSNTNEKLTEAIKNVTEAKENEKIQRMKFEELAYRFENINHIFAHDIKNVLAKNRDMFAEILAGTFGNITDQLKNFLKMLTLDTESLITSVTNILKSGDQMKPNPKPFNFKEAVWGSIKSIQGKADEQKIEIQTEIDENQDYTINGDRLLIIQHVLKNLIDNAINYSFPNGIVVINLSKKDPETILLAIKDSGWGMTEDDKKILFKAGGHGPDSIKKNVHTSGFGLFIATQTINIHKGKIYATSEGRNKGSTFFIELPIDFTTTVSSPSEEKSSSK